MVWFDPEGLMELRRQRLERGGIADVQAGDVHRFEVVEPGMVIEVYWPANKFDEVQLTDIERLDVGGCHG